MELQSASECVCGCVAKCVYIQARVCVCIEYERSINYRWLISFGTEWTDRRWTERNDLRVRKNLPSFTSRILVKRSRSRPHRGGWMDGVAKKKNSFEIADIQQFRQEWWNTGRGKSIFEDLDKLCSSYWKNPSRRWRTASTNPEGFQR